MTKKPLQKEALQVGEMAIEQLTLLTRMNKIKKIPEKHLSKNND